MSNKNLTILGLAAVIMVLLAAVSSKMASLQTVEVAIDSPLIQGLNPEQISRITVASGQEQTNMVRQGSDFVISDKNNYPADIEKVNNLIKKVLDIKVGETLTDNSENYDQLQVTDEKAERLVKFFNSEDKLITGIIVGKRLDSGDTAVRLAEGNAVKTTSDSAWFNTTPTDFMDTEIFNIEKDKIIEVSVKHKSGGEYKMTSEPNSSDIKFITALPQGKQLKERDYVNVFNALTSLYFSDVNTDDANDISFEITYTCKLDDSTVYILTIGQKQGQDDYYLKCSSQFTDLKQIEISKDESEQELKKKEARLLARDNAAKFNARHKGWVYQIASYKGDNLTKTIDQLTEDIPQPEPIAEDVNEPAPQPSPQQPDANSP